MRSTIIFDGVKTDRMLESDALTVIECWTQGNMPNVVS